MIEQALRQGAALLAQTPSSSSSSISEAMLEVHGVDKGKELAKPHRRQGCSGRLGSTAIAAEFSARAERSGWNTSVLFLEKEGAVRLRVVHRSEEEEEEDDGRRPRG